MSISVQVLDISEYNELPTVANGYTLVYDGGSVDDQGTSISLSSPYTLGLETFTSIYLQTNGWIQFLNTTYPTGDTNWTELISRFVTKYGIAVVWDDLYVYTGDSIGYKYANNNTQFIVNYNISRLGSSSLRVQFQMTINLNNHATSPGSIRIAHGRIEINGGGLFGIAYGPASTVPSANTMNYVISSTPTTFVYPNIPVQLFGGTNSNYLTNKTIVYNIKPISFNGFGELTNAIVNAKTLAQDIYIVGYNSIGASAFQGATGVTSITIPSSVTSIGESAFQGMTGLTSITIPSSVISIGGSNAFQGSGITKAFFEVSTLLDGLSITNGPNKTLYGKSSMSIYLSYKVFNGSGQLNNTIVNDNNLSYVRNLTITGFSSIGVSAFQDATGLTSITIPSSVTSIGANAFQDAIGLTSITIPSSVTSIGANAFLNSGLTSAIFAINTNVSTVGITLSNTPQTFFGKTGVTVSALDTKIFSGFGTLSGATAQLDNKTNVVIEGFTNIGVSAFSNATSLTSITIPSGVTSIGQQAFIYASKMTSITFAEGSKLTSIGQEAFYNTVLTSITIPSSVTSIGQGAFSYVSSLTSITIPASVTSIGIWMFNSALALTSITIPSGVTSIGEGMFYNTPSLTSITIPTSVISIGYRAFEGASKLSSISIPSGVTSIGARAFFGASSLTSITLPSGVTSIGDNAFYGASKLTSITIPEGVTSIGTNAFEGAAKLTSVTIPSGVTSIGSNAFLSSGLTQATINTARLGVTNFPTAVGPNQTIGGKSGVFIFALPYHFSGAGELTQAIVTNANLASNYISNVIISGYTTIGASAFYGASALTSITIPSNVTSIGTSAFKGATTLSSVTFRLGVGESSVLSSIGAQAFENTALTTVFFESASTVKKLGVLNVDLINGYTVSSFYGKASVTFIYTEAVRSTISAAPTAIISNNTFTSLLTNMGMNISNMTSQVIPITNDPYIEYRAKLTIPNGNLSTLSDVNKANIIDTVKSLYAAQLGININKIIVTLINGSIIANVNVLKDGVTDAMVPICFPKGTPVTTNQGVIAIEKLNPDIHTIRGKKIVAITQTRPIFEHIIAIDKNALGKNVPSAPIQISKEHKVFYKREMVKAKDLVEVCEGVTIIQYNGETLYNVLMEKHDKMMINNLICETLDPDNIMAKICGGKYNRYEQSNICKELNDIIKENNVKAYIKLYDSLK